MNAVVRITCLLAALAVTCGVVFGAVAENWRKFYTPTNFTDDASNMAVAGDGSVWVSASGDFANNLDIILLHYDISGNLLAHTDYDRAGFDDTATAVKVDSTGNAIVVGTTKDVNLNQDITVIKYDPSGNLLWAKNWDGSGLADTPFGLALDSSDNIYVVGSTNNGSNLDCVVIKYLPDGTQSWVKTYNGPSNLNDELRGIAVSNTGFVYVCGYSRNLGSQEDFLAIKYTTGGTQVWVKTFDGLAGKSDIASCIVLDSNGLPTVAGPSTGVGTDSDFWTIHLDANGNVVWQMRKDGGVGGGDNVTCIATASDNSVYVCGKLYTFSKSDMGVVKYDSSGNELWTQTFSQSALTDVEELRGVAVDQFDNVYVTGVSLGLVTLEYSSTGALLNTLMPVHSSSDRGVGVAVSPLGRLYVAGNWYISSGTDNVVVLQYKMTTPITGTLSLDSMDGPYPTSLSVDVRMSGTQQVIETDTLACAPNGALSGTLPQGSYDVSFKLQNWLRRTTPVVENGVAGTFSASCTNGDSTPDNSVNLLDLARILQAFGSSSWPNYADLNHDGNVGLKDLSTVLKNFGQVGDQ